MSTHETKIMEHLPNIAFDFDKSLDINNSIIIPIGKNCGASIFLRNCKIKGKTYPYDWAAESHIDEIIEVINNRNTFDINNWYKLKDKSTYLPHDKENDIHGIRENIFLNLNYTEKYKRRFERLFTDIFKPNVILLHHSLDISDKLSLEHKNKFRNINKTISFIEIYNFPGGIDENTGDVPYKKYVDYMLTIFKPNAITSFISDFLDIIDGNISRRYRLLRSEGGRIGQFRQKKLVYPCNYAKLYEHIISINTKYDLDITMFPNNKNNLLFNERNDIIKFLGYYLSKKHDIELF